jgi:hypothetical protein
MINSIAPRAAPESTSAHFSHGLLDLRKDMAATQVGAIQHDMRRYHLAFIRYGHGPDTVSADGWQTRDEWVEAHRQAEERRKARDAQKRASAAAEH